MKTTTTRREFLKETAVIGAAVAAMRATGSAAAENAVGKMPKIKIGSLEVSRLILGSNPFFGFSHGNPQATGDQMRKYYTQQRIMAVMDQAAEQGVQAVWMPSYPPARGPGGCSWGSRGVEVAPTS